MEIATRDDEVIRRRIIVFECVDAEGNAYLRMDESFRNANDAAWFGEALEDLGQQLRCAKDVQPQSKEYRPKLFSIAGRCAGKVRSIDSAELLGMLEDCDSSTDWIVTEEGGDGR